MKEKLNGKIVVCKREISLSSSFSRKNSIKDLQQKITHLKNKALSLQIRSLKKQKKKLMCCC